MHIRLLLVVLLLSSCADGYEDDWQASRADMTAAFEESKRLSDDPDERMQIIREIPAFQRAVARRDSILARGPELRYFNDSLARIDSGYYALFLLGRVSNLYYYHDTTQAVFAYMEALPWLKSASLEAQAEQARRFAETVGDAIDETWSPQMAALAYQAFSRAEYLALTRSDRTLYDLVDSSRTHVVERLFDMPDSVRIAFAPSASRPSNASWHLAAVTAALIFVFGFISYGIYIWRKKDPPPASSAPPGSTLAILDALWAICNDIEDVPVSIRSITTTLCRYPDNQRAMFMMAGLMTLAPEPTEETAPKVANTVRSRLLRYFQKQGWTMSTDAVLPRDRAEWATWFQQQGMTRRPPSALLDR